MKVTFAGGVGEHGRNCFLVEGESLSFLVDCGVMVGAAQPYPHLAPEQIVPLDYIFLTHSHADHTGALPWFVGQGFHGVVVASQKTLNQLKNLSAATQCLERFIQPDGLTLEWGRAGHCAGSVWYAFQLEGIRLLFSGDYTESSLVYGVDPIRGRVADLAVLDSAYGEEPRSPRQMGKDFLDAVEPYVSQKKAVLFPVPKYGRGQEILLLLQARWPQIPFYGDGHFQRQAQSLSTDEAWTLPQARQALAAVQVRPLGDYPPKSGFCFVSDPQLRHPQQEILAAQFAERGAVVLTGSVEKGFGAWDLLHQGKAQFARVPVHCTDQQRRELEAQNTFAQVVPYHTASWTHPQGWIELHETL